MATRKLRWLKVQISYVEGEEVGHWNSLTLGQTDMVLPVEDPSAPSIGTLADSVLSAGFELVQRTERLAPPEPIAEPIA
jgi:hypothetical protein